MDTQKNKSLIVQPKLSVNEKIEMVVSTLSENIDFTLLPGTKKKSLLIAGADKFVFIFELLTKYKRDTDIQDAFKDYKGVIVFKCELVDKNGKVWGEGRGAGQLGQGKNCETINSTIKMAEIRAKKDAVLNTFPIRDRFTQDIDEDITVKKNIKINNNNEVETF